MVIEYKDECVGCERCVRCGADHVIRAYCDCCGTEVGSPDELHELIGIGNGEQLCDDCVREALVEHFEALDIAAMIDILGVGIAGVTE